MNVKPSQKSFLSLESVAMTDIVMNLFIFFFISFSLLYTFNPKRESKIEVKLPEGETKDTASHGAEPFTITITSGNEIFIGKMRVLPEALKKELTSRAGVEKQSGLLVKSDRASSVDTLVKVLDAAKQVGIQKLGVAIQQSAQ